MSTLTTPPPFLKGYRTYLRQLSEADADRLTNWINNNEVTQYLNANWPKSPEEEVAWIESTKKDKTNLVLALCIIDTNEHIGTMGIHRIDFINGVGTTGALIGDPKHRGQGFGTDAKHALLQYAFHTLRLRKICSEVVDFNGASRRYQDKCGYREVGRRREHVFRHGSFHDMILTEVFKDEWERSWEEYKKGFE